MKMAEHNLFLERGTSSTKSTPGDLYVDGVWQCYTLEDVVREVPNRPVAEWKIPRVTAIPRGRYRVLYTRSARFSAAAGRDVFTLELLNVPGFSGIRVHGGNWATDTEGCVLVGTTRGPDAVYNSRVAIQQLEKIVRSWLDQNNEVWITIGDNGSRVKL